MQRTHIYLPEELNREIDNAARTQKKSKSEVIREALEKGLKATRPQKSSSAKALLNMAEQAKQFPGTYPSDLSTNHDYYTWGGPKRDPKA